MEYENLKDELLSAVDTGLKYSRTLDREAEFELYLYYRNQAGVSINQGVVDASEGIVEGNAVRVARSNSVSFASSSGISIDRIKRSIDEAIASLRSVSLKDERFKGFCKPKKPGIEGAFTADILNLGKEELIGFANDMMKEGLEFSQKIQTVGSNCSAEWGGFAVGNSQGLQQASRSAINGCEVFCIAADGEERRIGHEFDVARERLIEIEGVGKRAAQKAISLLGARKLNKTAVMPTIWKPIAAAAYVVPSLGQAAAGQNVVEGRSPLAGKLGKEIANSKLTITDDGQSPSGINTDAIDGEGHPQQRTTLIDRGKLNQFLFDTYYANIYGIKSTGNCWRHGQPFGSTLPYETAPSIRPKNIEVEHGSKSFDDLVALIDKPAILIVDMPIGIFHSNVATGEFSAVAQSTFLVEKGEIKWSL
ncbi:MAG: TldD/PmbA family protein, partial [Candidatus Bathyarchaeota archaeon]